MLRVRRLLALLCCAPCVAATGLSPTQTCTLIGLKLHSVSVRECLSLNLEETGHYTTSGLPILYKEYPPSATHKPKARVLVVGGIHGDEFSSFSVVFKWMSTLEQHHSGLFHWRIAPAINLDGLLASPATRTNANGVDLNRNLKHDGAPMSALDHWEKRVHRKPNRYPGPAPMSESESRWLASEIANFRPDFIVALHAPYDMIDYDGPDHVIPPPRIGSLKLGDIGAPPGSLGHYVGKRIPLLTIERPSAGGMPSPAEVRDMWVDLVRWLKASAGYSQRPS